MGFKDQLPEDRSCFQVSVDEGQTGDQNFLSTKVYAADTASKGMAMATVMRRDSWLQCSGFTREVQSTVQDLLSS